MILRNKLVPVALGAALLGGSVGAFVMRPAVKSESAPAAPAALAPSSTARAANTLPAQSLVASAAPAEAAQVSNEVAGVDNSAENECYREGFAEGVRAAREQGLAATTATSANRVVYRDAPRARRVARSSRGASRQVYYDYNRPRGRSFWQKHRDKLTVAMGAGGGALVGGLVGGKKGALIGGLAGAGGSALYTYKLRNRNRRY